MLRCLIVWQGDVDASEVPEINFYHHEELKVRHFSGGGVAVDSIFFPKDIVYLSNARVQARLSQDSLRATRPPEHYSSTPLPTFYWPVNAGFEPLSSAQLYINNDLLRITVLFSRALRTC